MMDFVMEFTFTLTFIWVFWCVVAYIARKPFHLLFRDPLLWVVTITGALFGMWVGIP